MSLEDEISSLAKLPLLSELDEEALRVLAFSTDTQTLRAGDTLLRRGERSEGGYFVLSGSFSLTRDGQDDPSAQVVGVGALIGEMAMIAPTENPATLIAREATTVLRFPRPLFQRVLREYPGSAARLRTSIEKNLTEFSSSLAGLGQQTVKS